MKLDDLEIYKLSLELSEDLWQIFLELPKQFRFSIGDQMLRSVDSIGANISEGYGRYHYRDSMKFYYNARGSLFETKHWLKLLLMRKFISEERYGELLGKLNTLGVKLNNFIDTIKRKL